MQGSSTKKSEGQHLLLCNIEGSLKPMSTGNTHPSLCHPEHPFESRHVNERIIANALTGTGLVTTCLVVI
jgi:hypothetical protein